MRRGIFKRGVVWSLTSQIANSASNFLFTLLVARSGLPADFGRFSVIFLTITTLMGLSRGTLGQSLLLQQLSSIARRGFFTSQCILAGAVSISVVAVGFATGFPVLDVTLLAVGALGAMVQDSLRFLAIRSSRSRLAACSDVTWLGAGAVVLVIFSDNSRSMTPAFAAWSAGAVSACIVLIPVAEGVSVRAAVSWLAVSRSKLLPLAGESSVFNLLSYATNWALVGLAGFSALGIYRAVGVATSPLATLGQAMAMITLRPRREGEAVAATVRKKLLAPLVFLWVSALSLAGIVYVPGVGELLFAQNWATVGPFIWVGVLGALGSMASFAVLNWLKVVRGPAATFVFRLRVCWIEPLLVLSGAATGLVVGPISGLAASQLAVGGIAAVRAKTELKWGDHDR